MGVEVVEDTEGFSKDFSYRAHNRLRSHADPHPLESGTRATAGRAPVAYGEKLKCLASGQELGYSFLLDKTS